MPLLHLIFLLSLLGIDGPSPNLSPALDKYFGTKDPDERAKLAAGIADNHRLEQVLSAMPNHDFWTSDPTATGPLPEPYLRFELASGRTITVKLEFPKNYEASSPLPLILIFDVDDFRPSAYQLEQKEICENSLCAVLSDPVGGQFHTDPEAAADLPRLLRMVRQRVRIDTKRVFVLGKGSGAYHAWVAALMYPSEFSGLIAVNGVSQIPYPEQSLPLLLPNLRTVPFLSAWNVNSAILSPTPVATVNQAIADFAGAAGMTFETVTLAVLPDGELPIPQKMLATALSRPRKLSKTVAMWFRFLPQGNLGWLRATELGSPPWQDDQISIVATSDVDRNDFILQTLKEKLFSLSGRIEGQKIVIETHRLEGIELRLSPTQVDLEAPITVEINGRVRFDGLLKPSVQDILESAYESWEFQDLVYARKHFSIHSK